MTDEEWLRSTDAPSMIDALWARQAGDPSDPQAVWRRQSLPLFSGGANPGNEDLRAFQHKMHRYYLLCCRTIWKLLPQEESRRGVEVVERFLAGEVDNDEFDYAEYSAEGAAFCINYDTDPEAIERWVAQTRALPAAELQSMLHPPESALHIDTRELLMQAAYFAHYSMVYPTLTPPGPAPESYAPFLSADLLREVFGNPFIDS